MVSDQLRRQRIYEGQIFVFTPRPSTIALCDFARELIEEAFGEGIKHFFLLPPLYPAKGTWWTNKTELNKQFTHHQIII
jgi:hypothetical protein